MVVPRLWALLGVLLDADPDRRRTAPAKARSAVDKDTEMDFGEIGGEGSHRAEGEPSWENLMDSDNESMTSEESKEDLLQARGDSSSESSSDEGPKK
jgi:hypothetical protein